MYTFTFYIYNINISSRHFFARFACMHRQEMHAPFLLHFFFCIHNIYIHVYTVITCDNFIFIFIFFRCIIIFIFILFAVISTGAFFFLLIIKIEAHIKFVPKMCQISENTTKGNDVFFCFSNNYFSFYFYFQFQGRFRQYHRLNPRL